MLISLAYQTFVIVILLAFSFGPAFFALINTSIKYGAKEGSLLATGVILSDLLICILVIYLISLGAESFIQDEKTQHFMGLLAGIILLVFGAFYFKKPVTVSEDSIEIQSPSAISLLLKGFFLNILNPAVWLLWLGNVTAVSKTLNYSVLKMFLYFAITLGIVWATELLKAHLAGKIKKYLTPKIMRLINITTGVLLILFGMVLIYTHYFAV